MIHAMANHADGEVKPGYQRYGNYFVKVEHPAGSIRNGIDPQGQAWSMRMTHDYGELPGSKGVDGDPVDVYLGPKPDAKIVHVVHMNDADGNYDEDKAYVGFPNQKAVIDSFKAHYPDGSARIGAITSHRDKDFRKKVRLTKTAGGTKLAAVGQQ